MNLRRHSLLLIALAVYAADLIVGLAGFSQLEIQQVFANSRFSKGLALYTAFYWSGVFALKLVLTRRRQISGHPFVIALGSMISLAFAFFGLIGVQVMAVCWLDKVR